MLARPIVSGQPDNAIVWKNDNTEPFGNSVPNENPSGLGTMEYNLRFPGQYYDQETGTFYNYFRDYRPDEGRYIQSDPIGLRGGLSTYSYVLNNPLRSRDPRGLFGEWADPSGPPSGNPDQPFGQPDYYWGWDVYYGAGGFGRTKFTCTDKCNKKHTYIYKKICVGNALGIGLSGGVVLGTSGENCKPENYAGWFFEGGYSLGPLSAGVDVGFNEDGPQIPGTSLRLPNTPSNVIEAGLGVGAGAPTKGVFCYYKLIKPE